MDVHVYAYIHAEANRGFEFGWRKLMIKLRDTSLVEKNIVDF